MSRYKYILMVAIAVIVGGYAAYACEDCYYEAAILTYSCEQVGSQWANTIEYNTLYLCRSHEYGYYCGYESEPTMYHWIKWYESEVDCQADENGSDAKHSMCAADTGSSDACP